ncbi:SagB/ThcOx family dehydrogenase [Leptothoe sp. LEGE 181152]|nr:SagB/ThcOx family dehydrogenase [Leptothoe sp. LEGE 181152]
MRGQNNYYLVDVKDKHHNAFYDKHLSPESYDFIEVSKITRYNVDDFGKHVHEITSNSYIVRHICNNSAELSSFESIPLPDLSDDNSACELLDSLQEIYHRRQSNRHYSPEGITFDELSKVLQGGCFILDPAKRKDDDKPIMRGMPARRNIGSGGGLYPIELFLISSNTVGLENGVYHYNQEQVTLDRLVPRGGFRDNNVKEIVQEIFFSLSRADMDFVNVSGIIILAGCLNRTAYKYQDRGLRFALIDAGAITQNLYLTCAAMDLGCCACGGYYDDELNEVLGLDGADETVLNVVLVGKKDIS